jgi:hypothetical protein
METHTRQKAPITDATRSLILSFQLRQFSSHFFVAAGFLAAISTLG